MNRRYPLHIHIATIFIGMTLLVGSLVGWLGYSVAQSILKDSATDISVRIGKESENALADLFSPAEMASQVLSQGDLPLATGLEQRLDSVSLMQSILKHSHALTSLYVGYGTGDFFLLRRLEDEADRRYFNAPEGAVYLIQSIERSQGRETGRYIYLDASLTRIKSEDRPEYAAGYDPRNRDWYKLAETATGQVKTPPYIFHSTGKLGSTIANRALHADAVIGADIRLETLDHLLAKQKTTPRTEVVIANREGFTLAYHQPGKAVVPPPSPGQAPGYARIGELAQVFQAVLPFLQQAGIEAPGSHVLNVAGQTWHATIHPILLEGTRQPLFLINAIPDDELMAAANGLLQSSLLAVILVILCAIPVTWLLSHSISSPMRKLASEAEIIRRFDFRQPITVKSKVLEVALLADTLARMKQTIHRFLDISQTAAGEKNFENLLPRLLNETLSASTGVAGILYLADDDEIKPAAIKLVDGSQAAYQVMPVKLASANSLFAQALATGHPYCEALSEIRGDTMGMDDMVQACGAVYGTAVPLKNREGHLVGAILLLGRERMDAALLAFIEALSGSLALSLEARELIHAQKLLFEAMIQLIASAIDAKSPYTGGHCARVPELTKMLARAACATRQGPFADFELTDEEWESVHVAAWLHDCGKVTTPEYVVDKATKLETLYDRIHEVRMRFEVLKRDAEIACWKSIAAGIPENDAQAILADELRQIDADFAFIAECNEGGEFMTPDRQERLAQIAGRTWLRTLDDRIGISHEEQERKQRTPAPLLPVQEPVLADKAEHIIERQARDRLPEDNRWGFRMAVPEFLYNKGELYNLRVARGTLSEEERYKINEHIVQTFLMLTQLPFPKHLQAVPEIAACHHEKMDGTGYPRRLTREQMNPVARMMAIADIFEALTAVDRPYKKGKTLSEAIAIMARMRDEQHIDPDLFDLFLEARVWRDYARLFMRPEQVDTVDTGKYARSIHREKL